MDKDAAAWQATEELATLQQAHTDSPTTSPPTKPNSDEPPPAKRPSPPSRRHRRRPPQTEGVAQQPATDGATGLRIATPNQDGPAYRPGLAHALQPSAPRARPPGRAAWTGRGRHVPPCHDDRFDGQAERWLPAIDATPLRGAPPDPMTLESVEEANHSTCSASASRRAPCELRDCATSTYGHAHRPSDTNPDRNPGNQSRPAVHSAVPLTRAASANSSSLMLADASGY